MAAKTEFKLDAHTSHTVKFLSPLPIPEIESQSKCNLIVKIPLQVEESLTKTYPSQTTTKQKKDQLTSQYCPQANGEVERFNYQMCPNQRQKLKRILTILIIVSQNSAYNNWYIYQYPAQILFHHIPSNGLTTIKPSKQRQSTIVKLITENKTNILTKNNSPSIKTFT